MSRSWPLYITVLFIGSVFILLGNHVTVLANERDEPAVRVSLFIDSRGTVPSITLSSQSGLRWAFSNNAEHTSWEEVSTETLRAGLDQYYIRVSETRQLSQAQRLAEQVGTASDPAYIFQLEREAGEAAYQVVTGPYPSSEVAQAAHRRLAPLSPDQTSAILQPAHWEVGSSMSFTEAELMAKDLQREGLDAWPVAVGQTNQPVTYAVWVGQAVQQNEREQTRNQLLNRMPDGEMKDAQTNQPYVLIRSGRLLDGDQAIHMFAGTEQTRVVFDTPGETIQVTERLNRSYRGIMELSAYQNRLALINELPLETYLVSVVGVEMGTGWPAEALKAQAVAARTYVYKQGKKYDIAHVSDTTYDQAYYGIEREAEDVAAAVHATKGVVLKDASGEYIEPLYHANAGGVTADSEEVWGNEVTYLRSVQSPDHGSENSRLKWARVVLENSMVGYVRSDYITDTGEKNAAGLPILVGTENEVNLRAAPFVNNETNPPIGQIHRGTRMVEMERRTESNAYRWVSGPHKADELERFITLRTGLDVSEGLRTLEITKSGQSGRVQEMKANGKVIPVSSPDAHRSALGNLLSTKFEVVETGRVAILGARDEMAEYAGTKRQPLYVMSSEASQQALFALDGHEQVRYITREPMFQFLGQGYGHGLGMSQWGARALAEEQGYRYDQILRHYYGDITVERD